MSVAEFVVRQDFERLSVSEWTYEECATWLWNEGVWVCGDDGSFANNGLDEMRIEVIIQAELIELEGHYKFNLVKDEFYRSIAEKHT